MFTRRDLQELVAARLRSPVLSVYLSVDPSQRTIDSYRPRLRQLVRPYLPEASADLEAALRFVEQEYDRTGRSLALFSCAAEGFFRSYAFHLRLRDRARRLDQPYVKPLAEVLDSYGDIGVAVVDKQGARLFRFHLGELREEQGVLGQAVRHTKRGGASTFPGRRGGVAGQTRRAEEVADRNLKDAARSASEFFRTNKVRRILIGGTDENATRFAPLLPKALQSRHMGTFPIEMTAGHDEVLEKAMAFVRAGEEEEETRLVEVMITAAAKGREGVIRLDDTLARVHEGRVKTLVLSEGFRAPGYRCRGCGYLTSQRLEGCPFCGRAFEKIEDAVEMAVRKVIADGGEVEVVRDNRDLERAGRIGALLRY
jgi:peptide subunit release factor 1 (eRF1)